jgi:hypothetical protein
VDQERISLQKFPEKSFSTATPDYNNYRKIEPAGNWPYITICM